MSCVTRTEDDKLQKLMRLMRSNVPVRACISRMLSSVVPKLVSIKERTSESTGFKPLASGLDVFLGKHLAKFLTSALEMTYMYL